MINILISGCLYGKKCRYDGEDNLIDALVLLHEKCNLFPVCPEVSGGLSTPRVPAEIIGDMVMTKESKDVTAEYKKGAEAALKTALDNECKIALLKAKSPSCGSGKVYDGTFSKTLADGDGITTKLLKEHGIQVYSENQIDELLKYIDEVEQ